LRTRTIRRAAAAAAVATVGLVGFGGVAGAQEPTTPYTVQPGDTLSRIAPDNWREVAAGNGIDNPDLILVGQVIDLSRTAPAPAYTPSASRGSSGGESGGESSSSSTRSRVTSSSSSGSSASSGGGSSAGGGVWDQLAQCESGGDWGISTGNGYYGGLQFDAGTWRAFGGGTYAALPNQASREEQIAVAEKVRDSRGGGYGAWPACSRKLGLPQ
jgi:LysM repeat protein